MSRLYFMRCGVCGQRIDLEVGECLGTCPGCKRACCMDCEVEGSDLCKECVAYAEPRPISESWLAFANEVFPESRSMTPDELREYNAVVERFFTPVSAREET